MSDPVAEIRRETERFVRRLDELKACRKPVSDEERKRWTPHPRYQHSGSCAETAAMRRASLDLTRALVKLRQSGVDEW